MNKNRLIITISIIFLLLILYNKIYTNYNIIKQEYIMDNNIASKNIYRYKIFSLLKLLENNSKAIIIINFTDEKYYINNMKKIVVLNFIRKALKISKYYVCKSNIDNNQNEFPIYFSLTLNIYLNRHDNSSVLSILYLENSNDKMVHDLLVIDTNSEVCFEVRGQNARNLMLNLFNELDMPLKFDE